MGKTDIFLWFCSCTHGIRRRILLSVAVGLLRVICALGMIYISKYLIDIATGSSEGSFIECVVWLCILITGVVSFSTVGSWQTSVSEVEIQNILRRRFYTHLLRSVCSHSAEMHSGDIQSRLETDLRSISCFLSISVPGSVINCIHLLATFFFFVSLDLRLALTSVTGMCFFLFFGKVYTMRMRRLTLEVRCIESSIQSLTQESVQYRNIIKTFERENFLNDELESLQKQLYKKIKDRSAFALLSKTLLSIGFSGGYLLALIWGGGQLRSGLISFGVITAYLQLTGQVQRPLMEMIRVISAFVSVLASADRLRELEEIACEPEGDAQVLSGAVGLRFRDVVFSYGEKKVINRFSYDFAPGSMTALIGSTGAGKTTLIKLILALYTPCGGDIAVYDKYMFVGISPLTRRNIAYVPQGNTLFSGTIRRNLQMGDPSATDEQMKNVLYAAAAEFVFDLPEGLDTYCGERGSGLSEGQAQRIAIARSLLRPGTLLLLDEATSALDRQTESVLLKRLYEFAERRTVIFITHRDELAVGCDQIRFPI